MKKRLKKYLIPHQENDHRPHILRDRAMKILLGLAILVEFFAIVLLLPVLPGKLSYLSAVLPSVLVEKTNDSRLDENLGELMVNDKLILAAQLKANDMAEKGYFAHVTPDGKQPWHFVQQAGYEYQVAGENLAVNFVDSRDVHRAWMNSPTHKANILKNNYTEIGIATARGQYKGRDAIFVAQFFASPKIISNEAVSPATPETPTEITENPEPEIVEELDEESEQENVVLGVESENVSISQNQESSIIAATTSSPRNLLNAILIVIALIIVASLILKVFIKIKIQHKDLIWNGILLLSVLILLLILNSQLLRTFAGAI